MTTISREYINEDFWHNAIVINIGKYSTVDFKVTKEQKYELYKKGLQTAMEVIPMKMT